MQTGTLFVVATPIGNLEDITVRALRVLREVALIAAEDTRRTAHLLARHAIATPTTSLHAHNEHRKTASLVDRLQSGDSIALVSDAGTPTVSDPGGELVAAAIAAGIRIEPIPGPSAILAALTASGFSYDSFTFLGFPPTKTKERRAWFDRLIQVGGTVVFFEAPHRIVRTLTELGIISGNCPIALGRELTKTHEEVVRDTLAGLAIWVDGQEQGVRGEVTLVVEGGHPVELDDDGLRQLVAVAEARGLSRKDAIAEVAARTGTRRKAVFDAAHSTS